VCKQATNTPPCKKIFLTYVRVHRKRPKTIEFNTRIQSYESQSVATIKAHSDQIMAKKRKRKKKEPENEAYEIEIEDWETAYHFAINTMPKDLGRRGVLGAFYADPDR